GPQADWAWALATWAEPVEPSDRGASPRDPVAGNRSTRRTRPRRRSQCRISGIARVPPGVLPCRVEGLELSLLRSFPWRFLRRVHQRPEFLRVLRRRAGSSRPPLRGLASSVRGGRAPADRASADGTR